MERPGFIFVPSYICRPPTEPKRPTGGIYLDSINYSSYNRSVSHNSTSHKVTIETMTSPYHIYKKSI